MGRGRGGGREGAAPVITADGQQLRQCQLKLATTGSKRDGAIDGARRDTDRIRNRNEREIGRNDESNQLD